MTDLRIAVCVPGDRWKAGFGFSVSNMIAHFALSKYEAGEHDIQLISVSGSMLAQIRTELVVRAMKYDATHMLFLDDDMEFPPDLLNKLIRHNVPVVGCNYSRRVLPPMPTAWGLDDEPVFTDDKASGLQEVLHLGTGAMLIDMRVFDLLREKLGEDAAPLFDFTWKKKEDGKPYLEGEDVFFCHKLRSVGVPIFVDHDASKGVIHLGEFKFENWQCTPETAAQAYRTREGF